MTSNKFINFGIIFLLISTVLFFGFDFIAFAISKLTLNPNFGGLSIIYSKMVLSVLGGIFFFGGVIKEFIKSQAVNSDAKNTKWFVFCLVLGIILVLIAFYTFFTPYYDLHNPLLNGTIYS